MGADAGTPPRVVAFFDFACPLCYVDRPRFVRLRDEHHVVLDFIPFELRPGIPARMTHAELGAGHSPRVEEYLVKAAAEEGLVLVHPDFVPNSHLALSLAELARDAGPEYYESTQGAIFRAYLGEGRDISQRDVLLRIAIEEGFEPAQVTEVWDERLYDERLAALRAYAIEIGVQVTPSAIVCDMLVIGSRHYSVLERVLSACEGGVAELEVSSDEPVLGTRGDIPAEATPGGHVADVT